MNFPISSRTVRRELHGMGFHGWTAASKPYISKCNAKHRMQWCKAHRHWTLEQWRRILWSDESHFSIWQSDGQVWVLAVATRTVLVWLHCAKCKVWWRGDYGVGLFFRSWAWPHSSSERNSECFGLRMGRPLISYVSKGRIANTFGNIVYIIWTSSLILSAGFSSHRLWLLTVAGPL